MSRIVICILLLLTTFGGNPLYAKLQGQAKIDSLHKELPLQKDDSNKSRLLKNLSFLYYSINPDEGIKYGQSALELATKLKWKGGMASAYGSLGTNYQYQSNYSKALECFFYAMKLYEELYYNVGIASVAGNIGLIYMEQNNNPKALEYLSKSLKLLEEAGDKVRIASATSNIGIIYMRQKYDKKALEYYLRALKMFEEVGDKQGIANNLGNIGNICTGQKNYLLAIEFGQRALKISEELGDKQSVCNTLTNIGSTYLEIISNPPSSVITVAVTEEVMGSNYKPTVSIPKGKDAILANAIGYLKRALAIATETKELHDMQNCYQILWKAYYLKGDYKQALEYQGKYHSIKDTIFSQENKEQMVKLEMRDQYGHQRLADSLKTAEKEKIAAINLQKQKSYTYLGIAGILLLGGFSFFIVKERGKSEKERKKSDNLLLNILPYRVAEELKANGSTTAKHYDNVTVLFTDFVNFTQAAEQMNAQGVIDELHACFKAFDEITTRYNIEKIKTIGDAYLAVCGLPAADTKHAEKVVRAATEINAFMQDRISKMGRERTFAVRIGIHSGSVVAGIVGVKKFAYDIWGDTVNTAARMEQYSEAGKINISETIYELVKDKFNCEYRGEVEVKGKGVMKMYFVR